MRLLANTARLYLLPLVVTTFNLSALPTASAQSLPDSALDAANAWLDERGIDMQNLRSLPIQERASRLNQAVYAFCRHGPQTPGPLTELYQDCSTACGGYSFVLRGLLEATGAQTRYVNLYNIPNQGNHTAVEVWTGTRWALFDPTFGAYFTEAGNVETDALSIHDLTVTRRTHDLSGYVLQSNKVQTDFMGTSLAELYPAEFEHPYMSLVNYQVAEAVSRDDRRELIALDIPLALSEGKAALGELTAEDFDTAQSAWLGQTNTLLLDDDLQNDVSFNTSLVSNNGNPRMATISASGASPGQYYTLELLFFTNAPQTLQIQPMGRSVFLEAESLTEIPRGRTLLRYRMYAESSEVRLYIRNAENSGRAHLFGVRITETDTQDG